MSVKTVDRKIWSIPAQPTSCITDIKEGLESKGLGCASRILLTHKGATLSDNTAIRDLGLHEGDFLVALVKKRSVKPERPMAYNDCPSRQAQRHQEWQPGDVVEVLCDQNTEQWYRAIVVRFNETEGYPRYLVTWVGDKSQTHVRPEFMRGAFPDLTDLQEAAANPMFAAFMNSPEFQAAMAPMKQIVAHNSEIVPEMVADMHKENPQQLMLMLPFLIAELERANPRVLGELMHMLKNTLGIDFHLPSAI